MRLFELLLRLFTARGWAGRLSALAALAVAAYALWQGELSARPLDNAPSASLQGRVVGVQDGDTLELLDASSQTHRVRLAFIDAPEHAQPYGTRARQHLAQLVFGKQITVKVNGEDKYGRVLGEVSQAGRDISAEQLAAGLAWHYVHYAQRDQTPAHFQRYQQLQAEARQQGTGLWQQARPQAPWDYRQQRR